MANREEFYLSIKGQQVGPWTVEKIVSQVKSGECSLTDYVFDSVRNDWVLLMESQTLLPHLGEVKPKAPPKPAIVPKADEGLPKSVENQNLPHHMVTEWYILKGENRFGPFAYPDVIKMLQEKLVFEFDFAWHPGISTWMRIAEIDAFKVENVRKLQGTLMPEISEVFFRRRHRRVQYGGTILIHDNNSVWKGQGVEISAGGAGVVMENSMIVPGQTLYLHFKPCDGVPPFNAVCEVVSKQYVDGIKDKSAPVRYGLKFKSISSNAQKFLQDYARRGEAA